MRVVQTAGFPRERGALALKRPEQNVNLVAVRRRFWPRGESGEAHAGRLPISSSGKGNTDEVHILICGGTSFVGRAISWSALQAGHQVTVINRGTTPSDLPSEVQRLVGDRHGDLSALNELTPDVTIDTLAYRPSDVDALARALGERVGHYVQISSVSAYEEPTRDGMTEDELTLHGEDGLDLDGPITPATYGPLKAAAERAAIRAFGDHTAFIRPTYVIGSHDKTMRFPYWVDRIARGGRVAVPGPWNSQLQWIDARDLGDFTVRIAASRTHDVLHVTNGFPSPSFGAVIQRVADHLAPAGTELVEVSADDVRAAGLSPAQFPLWSGGEMSSSLAVDPAKAIAAGLTVRALEDSVDDTLAWIKRQPRPSHWLTIENEAALVERATAS